MKLKHILLASTLLVQSFLYGQNYNITETQFTPELIGNLYQNKQKSKTVILIIPGSGPTNRDGNSGMLQTNSLKFLAEDLANQQYDVATYDKRVLHLIKNFKGAPEEFPAIDFQHGIDDAKSISNFLKDNLKYKNVVIIGHSEGSLIGMNAANKTSHAFVSIAGAGRSIDLILKDQIGKQAPMLIEPTEKILEELKKGNKVEEINPMLQAVFAKNNQPFIIEWIQHNPQQEIKALDMPVLLINGDKDLQVDVKEAELLKQAKTDAQLVIVKNMNHILKEIKEDSENLNSYYKSDLPLHKDLVPIITQFLKANKL